MGEGTILAVDVGTSSMKMGLFVPSSGGLRCAASFQQAYEVRTSHDGQWSDIEPRRWQHAFEAGARSLASELGDSGLGDSGLGGVEVIALSGTTPGLTAVDGEGAALYPAILMLDQRSREQARLAIRTVGLDRLLRETGNMPVSGGCSLASMLWLAGHEPEVFRRARWFLHSNGFMAIWLTGEPAIDPSSASLTGLYNTARGQADWNEDIAAACGIRTDRLPPVLPSAAAAGRLKPQIAARLGFRRRPLVLIGGNDAVLAAHSLGVREPGEVVNVNGTCEITLVCLDRCHASPSYNVRCHVVPGRWLTLYVMNAQGRAFEWFRSVFCAEMSVERFYGEFLPNSVDLWLERLSGVEYVPYLMGSRYSLETLKAGLTGLTAETTREELAAAVVRGLCRYQRAHLEEVGALVALHPVTRLSGGAVNPALIRAKQAWMRPGEYVYEEESSLRGAALLGMESLGLQIAP